jgi:hypothetical protein
MILPSLQPPLYDIPSVMRSPLLFPQELSGFLWKGDIDIDARPHFESSMEIKPKDG